MKLALFTLTLALFYLVEGKNDWSKACLDGTCAFDIAENSNSMGGTFEISGSPSAISDITPAAGWQVLNCTDSTNKQTIRLVCTDESKGCEDLFLNGARETIVRLPQDCGSGPFVRVVDHQIPDDQSLPSDVASNLMRHDGTLPKVHMLNINDDFENASGLHGNVSFSLKARSVVADNTVGKRQGKRQVFSGSVSAIETISFSNSTTLLQDSMLCPDDSPIGFTLEDMNVDLDQSVDFSINISVAIAGQLNPPAVLLFEFSAPTNATFEGSLNTQSSLQVNASSNFLLANVTLPSLSIPGLASINPSFLSHAPAVVLVQNQTNFNSFVDLNIGINKLNFSFPENKTLATVNISNPSVPIQVTMQPNARSSASFEVSVLSQLNVEVIALGEEVNLTVAYDAGLNVGMVSTPVIGIGNNLSACTNISSFVTLNVSNSGPFFNIFGKANTTTLLNQTHTMLDLCVTAAVGPPPGPTPPPPPATRRSMGSLYKRADPPFSCPALAAIAANPIAFTAMSG